ncbi:papain family cysteine protease [Ostertagia ostertagi]
MAEIITNGPVQATFLVHEDFFMYAGGVYQHTELAAQKGSGFTGQGYHSVRVLGCFAVPQVILALLLSSDGEWTIQQDVRIPYWLAANSWGRQWGEDGLFRILRGENHCEIESFVIGAWGKGSKRRRRFKLRKMRRRFRKL